LWIDRVLVRAHEADSFRTGLCSGTKAAVMTQFYYIRECPDAIPSRSFTVPPAPLA